MANIRKVQRAFSFTTLPENFIAKLALKASAKKSMLFSIPKIPNLRRIDIIMYFHYKNSVIYRSSAVRMLKSYYQAKNMPNIPDSPQKMAYSIESCYKALKEMLEMFIENKEFLIAANIYKLLADVAILNKEYERAIKYYSQIVFYSL